MDSNCYQCSKPLKTIEYLQCSGFCNQSVHLKCVGLKRPNMDFVNEHTNLLWFCDKCIDLLQTVKQNPLKSKEEVVAVISETIGASLAEIKCELQETKTLAKSLASKSQSIDSSGLPRIRPWPSIKRSRDFASKDTPKSRPDAKLLGGTKSVEKDQITVETVAKPPEKFWIYLSRIARHVTEDDIAELTKNCLQTQETVDVRKLVRKNADLNQLAFISFKVGVNMNLRDTALDPSVWPKGIFFREFESLQSERDFWGPAKVSRIDDGTLSMEVLVTPSL